MRASEWRDAMEEENAKNKAVADILDARCDKYSDDLAAVERERDEALRWKESSLNFEKALEKAEAERDALRAKLARLVEAAEHMLRAVDVVDADGELDDRIDGALIDNLRSAIRDAEEVAPSLDPPQAVK